MLQAQSDAEGIDEAIDEALADAVAWPDLYVRLLNVRVVRAFYLDRDPTDRIDELEREARRHGLRAMEAVAMIRRVHQLAANSLGATPFEALAEIRLLLDDATQPARDRVSGLIGLASTFVMLQLHALADETMREAMRVIELLDDPDEARAVCQFNRAFNATNEMLDALEAGFEEAARDALDRFVEIVDGASWHRLPESRVRELQAYRRFGACVTEEIWLDADEVAALLTGIDDACELNTLLHLVTPAEDWTDEPDLSEVLPPKDTAVQYLYARALERADGGDESTSIGREHARCLAEQSWSRRLTAGAALSARIDALRAAAESEVLRVQSITDALTGVCNRRAFTSLLDHRNGEPATMLTIDLDDFKLVNDRWGHAVGDAVLQRLASAMTSVLDAAVPARLEDSDDDIVIARVGGDEFVAIARGDDEARARDLVTAIVDGLKHVDWSDLLGDEVQRVTVGSACGPCGPELLARSDRQMYDRKRSDNPASVG